MAKAKQIKEAATVAAKTSKKKPAANLDYAPNQANNLVELPVSSISVSEFTPQSHRRSRFKPEQLAELAESIKQQGLINAITVRPRDWQPDLTESGRYGAMLHKSRPDWQLRHIGKKTEAEAQAWCDENRFEIVAGERRFEAAKLAGLDTILCSVKDLNDEQSLETQLQENLQRVDVDPLDEAFSYDYLTKTKNYSLDDLMVKFGKTEKFVRNRLKLNDLIPAAADLVAAGTLPLGHAMEISKYPVAAQEEIVVENYAFRFKDKNYPVLSLTDFLEVIKNKISLPLAGAPFDTEDPTLRADGLICPNCTMRTGYAPTLFAEGFKSQDLCLNRPCYETKSLRQIEKLRSRAAETLPNPENIAVEQMIKSVPLVSDSWLMGGIKKTFGDAEFLERQTLYESAECASAREAVAISGSSQGKTVYICRDENCATHHAGDEKPASLPSSWQLQRQEKEFQLNVQMKTRSRVFIAALDHFAANNFFDDASLVKYLVLRLLKDAQYKISNYKAIGEIFEAFAPDAETWTAEKNSRRFVQNLNTPQLSQLLFLLAFVEDGFSSYELTPQDNIKELADKYAGLEYKEVFADAFVELASDDQKAVAEDFRRKIFAGQSPEPPRFFWTKEMEQAEEAESDDDNDGDNSDDNDDSFQSLDDDPED